MKVTLHNFIFIYTERCHPANDSAIQTVQNVFKFVSIQKPRLEIHEWESMRLDLNFKAHECFQIRWIEWQ
jgi:hypothetical protein